MNVKDVTDLISAEAWASYIVGAGVVSAGLWQWNRTFRLNKNATVFDELAKDIQEASNIVDTINTETQHLIDQLAKAANSANFDPAGKTQSEQDAEIERRLKEIDEIADQHKKRLDAIHKGYEQILLLIRKIEKSTIVSESSRQAARYLFYAATAQHQLMGVVSDVLLSFRVTPSLGENPNISSQTFNQFIALIHIVNPKNNVIRTYLEDLEAVLHNDLVKRIYGKARYSSIPVEHLGSEGLTDTRVKQSLL